MSADLQSMYSYRFSDAHKAQMAAVWRVLVDDVFQRWISPTAAVLDVGAGFCNFINQVRAGRRVATDANPHVAANCAPGVEFIQAAGLDGVELGGRFDVAFMSNVLEHLDGPDQVLQCLKDLHGHLNNGGRLIVLQPNFALVGPAYFDFIDHKTILTDRSLVEALELTGYRILYVKKRFLPYTSIQSKLPRSPWLVRLYLKLPLAQFFMGKQTLVVAEKLS